MKKNKEKKERKTLIENYFSRYDGGIENLENWSVETESFIKKLKTLNRKIG